MAIISKKKTEVKGKAISFESKKFMANHISAAKHHEAAAKFHIEAAKHYEAGNDEKAHKSSLMASGHSNEANTLNRDVAKLHTLGKS